MDCCVDHILSQGQFQHVIMLQWQDSNWDWTVAGLPETARHGCGVLESFSPERRYTGSPPHIVLHTAGHLRRHRSAVTVLRRRLAGRPDPIRVHGRAGRGGVHAIRQSDWPRTAVAEAAHGHGSRQGLSDALARKGRRQWQRRPTRHLHLAHLRHPRPACVRRVERERVVHRREVTAERRQACRR